MKAGKGGMSRALGNGAMYQVKIPTSRLQKKGDEGHGTNQGGTGRTPTEPGGGVKTVVKAKVSRERTGVQKGDDPFGLENRSGGKEESA